MLDRPQSIYQSFMKYEEFNTLFKNKVNSLTREKLLDLAISICKKLFPDYQQFYLEHNWGDPDILLDSIKLCEVFKAQEVSLHSVKEMLSKVDKITPDTEDFVDASYALNASAAVYRDIRIYS